MANSVETRYPFLDEDVIAFASRLHPRWKLHGLRGDKYLLRQAAARLLPEAVAQRKKAMFRAPLAETFLAKPPSFVRDLISPDSLARTGYFDASAIARDSAALTSGRRQARNVREPRARRRDRHPALASPLSRRRIVRAAAYRASACRRATGGDRHLSPWRNNDSSISLDLKARATERGFPRRWSESGPRHSCHGQGRAPRLTRTMRNRPSLASRQSS